MIHQRIAAAFVVSLLLISSFVNGQQNEQPAYCYSFATINEVTKEDKQVETVTSIFEDLSPDVAEALNLSFIGADNSSMQGSLRIIYNTLAERFNSKETKTGYSKFIQAINEISLAQAEACSNSSFVPAPELVSDLAEEFETAFLAEEKDFSKMRKIFGKLLCLNTRAVENSEAKRRRRETCPCPDVVVKRNLKGVKKICEVFSCLRIYDIKELKPLFGFEKPSESIKCLAFALDVSGSMVEELDSAKQIITAFLVNEGTLASGGVCYILVPFSRFDDKPDVYEPKIVYIKDEEQSPAQLVEFVNYLNGLELEGGSGGPEHSIDGMLAALKATNADGTELMIAGSQLIVLTDEPTENAHLTDDVIQEANKRGVCIHFFLREGALEETSFERIANETSGTTIQEFLSFEFSQFIAAYENSECNTQPGTKNDDKPKRSIMTKNKVVKRNIGASRCKTFHVSSFAYLIRVSIHVNLFGAQVLITRPNTTVTNHTASGFGLVAYSEVNPEGGRWEACTNIGSLNVSVSQQIVFDTSVLFVNEGSDSPSSLPPPLCTSSRIAFLSSQSTSILYASLNLIDSRGNRAKRINMKTCKDYFVSDIITFPRGTYNIQLAGYDLHGVGFQQDTTHRVDFDAGGKVDYRIIALEGQSVEMSIGGNASFTFQLNNPSQYSTRFTFASSSVKGFKKQVTPFLVTIQPAETANVTLTIEADPLQATGKYKFTLFASNGCSTLSASKTVILRE